MPSLSDAADNFSEGIIVAVCSSQGRYIMGSNHGRGKPKTTQHISLKRKSKDWLDWNQDNYVLMARHVYPPTVVSPNNPK
jgi:hypothetical protein